ncbi:MAG: hypothetical protein ACXADW_20710 [Candidatus Hodarchaeales archaeon]
MNKLGAMYPKDKAAMALFKWALKMTGKGYKIGAIKDWNTEIHINMEDLIQKGVITEECEYKL